MNYLDTKCPACSAKLNVKPGQKSVKCEYCDSVFMIKRGELQEATEVEKAELERLERDTKAKKENKESDTDKAIREAQEEIDRNTKKLPSILYPGRALMSYFLPSLIVLRLINNWIAKDLGPVKLVFGLIVALIVFIIVDVSCVLYEKYLCIMIKGADERIRTLKGETISREENRELERVVMAGLNGDYGTVGAAALKGSRTINPLMIILAGPWLLLYPIMATHTLKVKNPYKKKTANIMLVFIWGVFAISYATLITSVIGVIR
ncbi:Uncharacterized Zn-finger containing protein, UPF0148 family [Lachnospiraceae bacterium]|nr:Uncharacterized Zn-finger containing protein, UPF0148 family [Lachnospiraceae bacterium]